MRKAALLCIVAALGVAAGCGSSGQKNKTNPTIEQPPPQPTSSTQKTGTPSTPRNTGRTTTAEKSTTQD